LILKAITRLEAMRYFQARTSEVLGTSEVSPELIVLPGDSLDRVRTPRNRTIGAKTVWEQGVQLPDEGPH
jgi:hypothetical protein